MDSHDGLERWQAQLSIPEKIVREQKTMASEASRGCLVVETFRT